MSCVPRSVRNGLEDPFTQVGRFCDWVDVVLRELQSPRFHEYAILGFTILAISKHPSARSLEESGCKQSISSLMTDHSGARSHDQQLAPPSTGPVSCGEATESGCADLKKNQTGNLLIRCWSSQSSGCVQNESAITRIERVGVCCLLMDTDCKLQGGNNRLSNQMRSNVRTLWMPSS